MSTDNDVKINNDKMTAACIIVLAICVTIMAVYFRYDRDHPSKTRVLSTDIYVSVGGCFDHKTISYIEINNVSDDAVAYCHDGSSFDIDELYNKTMNTDLSKKAEKTIKK